MSYATRDAIFQGIQRRYADVAVKLGTFKIQSLNDLEKSRYDSAAISSKGKFNRYAANTANARLIVLACVEPKFTESDIPQLQQLDAADVQELADAIRSHCGFDEEPEKNLSTTDSGDSPTS